MGRGPVDIFLIYKKQINIERLSDSEEKDLIEQAQSGNSQAKDTVVKSNLGLVIPIATKYLRRCLEYSNLAILDLIQEGNMGLMEAVDHFEDVNGSKFSTYAKFWIKKYILLALSQHSRIVTISDSVMRNASVYDKTRRILCQELGREPLEEEMIEGLAGQTKGVSPKIVFKGMNIREFFGLLLDQMENKRQNPFAQDLDHDFFRAAINRVLNTLNETEQKIVAQRFGFDGQETHTIGELAEMFNLTEGGVKYYIRKAYGRLLADKIIRKWAS